MRNEKELALDPQESHTAVKGFDYIELYVGNAWQAMHFYRTVFGFTPVAYAGLDTGVRDRVSFVVQQGKINLVLTSAVSADGPIAEHVRVHGDGVKDIAFRVNDAERAFADTVRLGARAVHEPTVVEGPEGRIVKATIAAWGDTVHTFVQRGSYDGPFFPGYKPMKRSLPGGRYGLAAIDHVAVSVEKGRLDYWADFYKRVLNFRQSHQEDISTEYSAMNSKVVENESGKIKFPMQEPADGKRKSQIEEYLSFYGGAGVQHIALLSGNIVETVRGLRADGVEFLNIPSAYYEALEGRVGRLPEELSTLRELNILVDRDESGYLLQVFTRPLQSRPTLFMEIIQRKGARGFGAGNIRALFEAVEREQAARGTL
jgi:4-hydroxyphenylpyruvate dioxygenase